MPAMTIQPLPGITARSSKMTVKNQPCFQGSAKQDELKQASDRPYSLAYELIKSYTGNDHRLFYRIPTDTIKKMEQQLLHHFEENSSVENPDFSNIQLVLGHFIINEAIRQNQNKSVTVRFNYKGALRIGTKDFYTPKPELLELIGEHIDGNRYFGPDTTMAQRLEGLYHMTRLEKYRRGALAVLKAIDPVKLALKQSPEIVKTLTTAVSEISAQAHLSPAVYNNNAVYQKASDISNELSDQYEKLSKQAQADLIG